MKQWLTNIKEWKIVKGPVYAIVGLLSYPGLNLINKLEINGIENLQKLPKQNVLFVSNHQTYFADVITFLHIFCAVSWGKKKKLGVPYYLLWPFTKVKYVAAEETMKNNWISKLFSLAGAITVKRTWRAEGQEVRNGLDISGYQKNRESITKKLGNHFSSRHNKAICTWPKRYRIHH